MSSDKFKGLTQEQIENFIRNSDEVKRDEQRFLYEQFKKQYGGGAKPEPGKPVTHGAVKEIKVVKITSQGTIDSSTKAENAFDNLRSTYWGAKDKGSFLQVDFGTEVPDVGAVGIKILEGQFDLVVATSTDGNNFIAALAIKTKEAGDVSHRYDFKERPARFLRVTTVSENVQINTLRCYELDTVVIPPPGGVDESGIKLLVPIKAGGKTWRKLSYKFSTHNTGTRDTFSTEIGAPMSIAATGYYNISLSDNSEELSNKIGGGNHTDSAPMQGRCYSIGIEQNGGPSFKKEIKHPDTPDFSSKVTFFDPSFKSIGSVKNKDVGLAVFMLTNPSAKQVDFECWVDTSGLKDGKPQNQWKPFYKVSDTGSNLKQAAYLENQGIANGGKGIYYMRIDTVTRKTKIIGPVVYEIDRLPSKN